MAIIRARKSFRGFLSGIAVGALLTYWFFTLKSSKSSDHEQLLPKDWSFHQARVEDDSSIVADKIEWSALKSIDQKSDQIASNLKKRVRILCWVMTSPDNLATRAVHVNATWGQRCNVLLFMSSKTGQPVASNLSLPVVELDVPEGRENLWEKTKAAFKYIFRRHRRDADWFFKVDDDTYAVVENLRHLLKDKDSNAPVYLGRRFNGWANQGYMSGGAGYVLSHSAMRRLVTTLIQDPGSCSDVLNGVEDAMMGICLERCGVKAMDTRDAVGRQTFHPMVPWEHLMVDLIGKDFWIFGADYYPYEPGPECCSNYTISFHYIPSYLMYLLDFLVYRVKTYGITKDCGLHEDEETRKMKRM